MTKVSLAAAVALTAMALAAPMASANDSTATTGAGGLVLTRSADIDMREEDLFVSARQIRVRYVFRNRAAQDRRVTVAFPMPDRDLGSEANVAFPADFRTTVDGRPVQMNREVRAFVGGREVTAELRRLRVPLTPGTNPEVNDAARALDRLPAADQQRLVAANIARIEEYGTNPDPNVPLERHVIPAWTVREMWSWEQTFPTGRDLVVEHQYTPGAGGSVGSLLTIENPDAQIRSEVASMRRQYCIDNDFMRSARRLGRQADGSMIAPQQTVSYILTTGGNWRSPIGRFRMVIDKGHASNIVSFCGQGIRRISPTQFEVVRTNWRPDRDLDVLIMGSSETLFPDGQ